MSSKLDAPGSRRVQHLSEELRLGLEALDAAGAGIAAAMRADTIDPEGVQQLLHLLYLSLKGNADTLLSTLVDQ